MNAYDLGRELLERNAIACTDLNQENRSNIQCKHHREAIIRLEHG